MRKSKLYLIPENDFRCLIQNCKSRSDFIFRVGMNKTGGVFSVLNRRISELGIDVSHFDNYCKSAKAIVANTRPLLEVMVKNSNYNANDLKKRLLREGILKNECFKCGNQGMWLDEILVLQLDHINGKRRDHRLPNLRIACPNCHTQTKTWGQKARV